MSHSKMEIKLIGKLLVLLVGVSLFSHSVIQAGVYSGSTSTATFNSLLSQVQAKSVALSNKVAEANVAGVNTDYAKVSQVTIRLFKDIYAPWDRANSNAIVAKYNANTFKSGNDPVGPIGLPFDELADCLELADAAIAELQAQIDGNITLQAPPNFATGGVSLNGTHYKQNGKVVLPHYFFWHPFDEDIMQAYGRMGEGYLALTDMASSNTVKSWRYSGLVNLMSNQVTANRSPNQFFVGHVDYSNSWHRANTPDAFNVGGRLFTDYDIDHPYVRPWLDQLFSKMLLPAVTACQTNERIHMLANEPVWSIRQGGVDATQGISSYTTGKFATWLQTKYGSTTILNATWGTSHGSFSAAANANYVANSGVSTNLQGGPIWYDWCRFNMDRVNDWFAYLHNGVKSVDPNAQGKTHIKVMGERSMHAVYHDEGLDFEYINNLVDLPGADNQMCSRRAYDSEYYQLLNVGDWYNRYQLEWRKQSLMVDFVKSLNPEKSFYDSEWHGLSGSRWRDFHMEPKYVRAALWLASTHGVAAFNAWVWCRYDGNEGGTQNGQPQNGSDFFGESATQPLQLDAWGRTMKELNAHGNAVASLVPAQRYYVMYYCKDAAIQDATYTTTLADVYESLKLLNVPVGFTTPAKLATVTNASQTLIMPPTKFISNADLASLQSFAASGGKIVVVNSASNFTKTEQGGNRGGGAGFTPYATVNLGAVLTMADTFGAALAPRKPALPVLFDIKTTNGVAAYGVLCNQSTNPISGGQTFSLINVSKDPRRVTVQLPSAPSFVLTNLITGKIIATNTITLLPQDVFLIAATSGSVAPTNLMATAGNAQVALTWAAVSGATSYNMKRSTTDGGPYTIIASPVATNHTDTTAVNGTTYFYVVSAVNGGGESFNSTQVSATPQPPPPVTPINLITTVNNAQVVLSWTAVSGATSYNVRRSTTNGGPYAIIASPNTANHTDTTVAYGTTYHYVVSAVNGGGESGNSAQASATLPPAPALVTIIGGTNGNGDFNNGVAYNPPLVTLTFAATPNWHWANGDDSTQVFARNDLMVGSPDANSGGGYVYQGRLVVNDSGYTIGAAGETFSLTYVFGAGGSGYTGAEFLRAYLFTATAPVDAALTTANMTQLGGNADYYMNRNTGPQWTSYTNLNLYTTLTGDVGKKVYLAVQFTSGTSANPRLENVVVTVASPPPPTCPAPVLSIVPNGANVDISWLSAAGCSYQLQTNSSIPGVWGNFGNSISGDGSIKTTSVPVTGAAQYFRAVVP